MEKALDLLKKLREDDISFGATENDLFELNNAIAELEEEAIKPKTCEGCKYAMYGVDSLGIEFDCGIGFRCTRGQKDRYEKDTQC